MCPTFKALALELSDFVMNLMFYWGLDFEALGFSMWLNWSKDDAALWLFVLVPAPLDTIKANWW